MGQGLGRVGYLEPTGSEANSTSFYSNNTSVNMQQTNLNNSRYLLNRRENKIGQPLIGKVIPTVTKSIDGYQSNFPVVGLQKNNPLPHLKNGSFYSSQNPTNPPPQGSNNYEKVQAKYGVVKPNYINPSPA
jgi:hypothetical protein